MIYNMSWAKSVQFLILTPISLRSILIFPTIYTKLILMIQQWKQMSLSSPHSSLKENSMKPNCQHLQIICMFLLLWMCVCICISGIELLYLFFSSLYSMKPLLAESFFIFSQGSICYNDVYRHESGRCRTFPFFLTYFFIIQLSRFFSIRYRVSTEESHCSVWTGFSSQYLDYVLAGMSEICTEGYPTLSTLILSWS